MAIQWKVELLVAWNSPFEKDRLEQFCCFSSVTKEDEKDWLLCKFDAWGLTEGVNRAPLEMHYN